MSLTYINNELIVCSLHGHTTCCLSYITLKCSTKYSINNGCDMCCTILLSFTVNTSFGLIKFLFQSGATYDSDEADDAFISSTY